MTSTYRKRRYSTGVLGVLCTVFITCGIIALWDGSTIVINGIESRMWPSFSGKVVASVISEVSEDGPTAYYPDIRYKYGVGCVPYVGDHYAYDARFYRGNSAWAVGIMPRHPVGATPNVYKPTNPQVAVLAPGFHWIACFSLGLGALSIFFGIAGYRSWKANRRNEEVTAGGHADANKALADSVRQPSVAPLLQTIGMLDRLRTLLSFVAFVCIVLSFKFPVFGIIGCVAMWLILIVFLAFFVIGLRFMKKGKGRKLQLPHNQVPDDTARKLADPQH